TKSPFYDLAEKLNLKVDFRPFIQVDPIPGKDFRKTERINFLDHSAVIFNSRNAVDHFFRACEELKIEMPPEMKYFCINEGMAYYLQKYIVMRKRKIFYGNGSESDLLTIIKNHSGENYLYPCSDIRKPSIPDFLTKNKIKFKEAILYRTVSADLSDLEDVFYDIIVFYSPADIKSLFENFPDFQQNNTRIAAWGATTAAAIEEAKLTLNIPAPTADAPSMTMALENYIVQVNK
ncbi:MAG: uroporphyrinogen-III synthase, partial [Bacteroidota bacterium]|nr:uroporphyrinogen-III synthase [Bacteroidota bacterium]MDX5430966.1 uroporphyrinogen-III synthase [Bacteroidota bacterium]MDX5469717.1 uroporphyrinogen-III synthase [Bacteroidota bacterium]